ncbi:MAG TPA: HAD hydrolase-like protein [Rhodanobacteraceae bacterium]|nr:HAD hydrolase-like protein [Rhodanobacteraceae bacterium]
MLLLFDLDGTLIDSAPGIIACIEHACTAMSVAAPPRAVLRGWIGPPLGETFPGVVGSDPGRVDAAIAHYRERFDRIGWREHRVHAGMDAVIAAQRAAGHTLAIVTTKVQTQAERIVAALPFGDAFARVYGPTADARHCEKAQMIAQAMADFRHAAAATRVIGDRHHDIAGARAHGVASCGVLWGYGSASELEAAGATVLVEQPAALAAWLSDPAAPATSRSARAATL